ncbi:MAG: hypothetical protein EPO68_11465 [Planctomycetota bacterium]|nr:MAG: hypothetical protein EPO68_11465 [Planctomycetota bacterium]
MRVFRIAARCGFELLFLAALAVLALLVLGEVLPDTEWARKRVRDELARELAMPAENIAFERVRVRWFHPRIELKGLALGPDGRDARIGSARLQFEWRPRMPGGSAPWAELVAIEVAKGRLQISPEWLRELEQLGSGFGARASDAAPRRPLPPVSVREIAIALVGSDARTIELGLLDAQAEEQGGHIALVGELRSSVGLTAPATVHVEGRGELGSGFELDAWGAGMRVTRDRLAELLPGVELPLLDFGADCDLVCRARVPARAGEPIEASLALRLRDGHAELAAARKFGAARLALELACRAERIEDLWSGRAWDGRAELDAEFEGVAFAARAQLGRRGDAPHLGAQLTVPDLPLDRALLEAIGAWPHVQRDWEALDPSGRAALHARVDVPVRGEWSALGGALRELEIAAALECDGRAGIRFRGWPEHDGIRRGFPLPASEARGRVLYVRAPSSARPERAGLMDLVARVPDGAERRDVHCHGFVGSPDRSATVLAGERPRPELDLRLEIPYLRLGPELKQALGAMPETAFIWPEFEPSGGSVSTRWRLVQNDALHGLAASGDIDLSDAKARWSELPVPLQQLVGTLRLRFAAQPYAQHSGEEIVRWHRPVGVAFDLKGLSQTGESVRVQGIVRGEAPAEPSAASADAQRESHWIDVALEQLAWKGQAVKDLASWEPEIKRRIAEFNPSGKVDAHWRGGRAYPEAPYRWDLELEMGGARVVPGALGADVSDVSGRVCVSSQGGGGTEKPELGFALALQAYAWKEARATVSARAEPGASAELVFHAAGVDPANAAVRGTLSALRAGGERGVDRGSLELAGRLDLHGRLQIELDDAIAPSPSMTAWPRDMTMRWGSFELVDVSGPVTYADEVLRADRLTARMAGTPVVLRDVRLFSHGAPGVDAEQLARLGDVRIAPGSTVFLADLGELAVPLDREHLAALFGAATVDEFARFELAGTLRAQGVRLLVFGESASGGAVHASGTLGLEGFRASVGVPIAIDTGSIDLESLVIERGRVRGWARLSQGAGAIAGRTFADASLVASFVDGRLNIDDLSTGFQGGKLSSLGGERGNAFALDLAEPYHFSLALELAKVQLEGLLKGVFDSGIADSGMCDARVRLSGRFSDLQDLQGSGTIELLDTHLWSIPVVRDLFSQIGFDSSATFQEMRTRFDLRAGEIRMQPIVVTSPLLRLEGAGRLGLDGRLRHDFELRYAVVDRLGPFTRLLYWVQNNLLKVAVRGDIARPVVILRGRLWDLFRERDTLARHLPLPAFSPLPARF